MVRPSILALITRLMGRKPTRLFLAFLILELLDEFVFSARHAAWPVVRSGLGLRYAQVGLLLSVPDIVANVIEPFIGISGDVWNRRVVIIVGGLIYTFGLFAFATSHAFLFLLFGLICLTTAAGAFVSLSQATLMDVDPSRHVQNMARWNFIGSVGTVVGPLVLAACLGFNLGWRGLFLAAAIIALAVTGLVGTCSFPRVREHTVPLTFIDGVKGALHAFRRRDVLRWALLGQIAGVPTDILVAYLALYLVDRVGATPTQAGIVVGIGTMIGLLGDLVLIPLLARRQSLNYLRASVIANLILVPVFLLVPGLVAKSFLYGALTLSYAGWYTILKSRLYTLMPGQSGTVLTIGNLFGLVRAMIPVTLGVVADHYGLSPVMWCLVLGPAILLWGLRTNSPSSEL